MHEWAQSRSVCKNDNDHDHDDYDYDDDDDDDDEDRRQIQHGCLTLQISAYPLDFYTIHNIINKWLFCDVKSKNGIDSWFSDATDSFPLSLAIKTFSVALLWHNFKELLTQKCPQFFILSSF